MTIFDDEDIMEDDGDEFAGYTIVDENADYRRKIFEAAQPDPETVATPIPENEQTVLVDHARFSFLVKGTPLTLTLNGDEGAVFHGAEKVADLKPAYVKKLLADRAGWYATATVHEKSPAMIKLEFSQKAKKDGIKI